MLKYYFRETFAGRLINILSEDRLLKAPQPEIPAQVTTDIDTAAGDVRNGHLAPTDFELKPSEKSSRMLFDDPTPAGGGTEIAQLARGLSQPNSSSPLNATTPPEKDIEGGNHQYLVGWNGDNDPENPRNWPMWLKVWSTSMISFLTFAIYIGSAIYTTGIEGVNEQFHVSRVVSTLGLSLFVLGYGVGPMFLAPFSEAPPIGRMPVYILTHLVFIGLQFPVIYARNIGTLLTFRFLSGFIGSPVLATGAASLADLFTPKKLPYAVAIWGNFGICGPVLGPLVSGFAVMAKGWKWSIWILVWLNALCALCLILAMPETSAENILYRRARRLRKATDDAKYKSAAEIEMEHFSVKQVVMTLLVRPFWLCFVSEPILLVQNVYLGLIYAVLYCWFDAFPVVFMEMYGFNLGQMGLAYIGILVGAFVYLPPYFWWIRKVIEPQSRADGSIEPEKRLPAAIVGSLFMPVCLFWFGWSSRPDIHWTMPIIGSSLFITGGAPLFGALINYQADAYPKVVGSVLAGNDLMRSSFGAAFPLFATQMYHKLGVDWACSMLGFISIAFIPMPIALLYYGKRLRMASKYARHDI